MSTTEFDVSSLRFRNQSLAFFSKAGFLFLALDESKGVSTSRRRRLEKIFEGYLQDTAPDPSRGRFVTKVFSKDIVQPLTGRAIHTYDHPYPITKCLVAA